MRWTAILVACVLGGGGVVTAVQGQEATGRITGVVRLQSGAPVAGANVMLGGTRIGGVAGDDGRYLIAPVPAGRYQLRVSMIGYATVEREVVVGAGATVQADVELQVQALALGEVVVVGYGTRRRAEVTGAVTTVSTSARESAPVQSLDQLLQGTAAGVVVTQASSAPGGGISVRVRGTTSINGNTEPLYVIDGFPIENDIAAASPGNGGREGGIAPSNPLAGLNPADIESLQILKDASATAIYGARGANGVVIITTRSGKVGEGARSRPQLTVDLFGGTQSVAKRYELLNSSELAQAINEYRTTGNNPVIFSDPSSLGVGTDWQDEIFRPAGLRSFQATISGASAGDNFTRYAISGGLFDQDGVVRGSSFERLSVRANVEQNMENRFRVGLNLTASRVRTKFVPTDGESNRRAGAVGAAIQAYPFLPVQFEDGSYPYQVRDLNTVFGSTPLTAGIAAELPNPVSMATEVQDELGDTRLLGNAFGEYEPLSGLRARVSVGGDYSGRYRDTYFPRTTRPGEEAQGNAIRGRVELTSFLNENTLTYDRALGTAHRFNLLAGFTQQKQETVRTNIEGSVYVSDITGFDDVGAGTAIPEIGSRREEWQLISWLGRVNYTLLDRYMFTLTGRRDGSSRFGKENRWGFFPSGAVAWRISGEPFLAGTPGLDELKLRASYGVAGNPSIRPYQSLARLDDQGYSFTGVQVPGYFPIGVSNPALTWETTTQLDIGLDVGLWGRLSLAADYYHKDTDDLLLQVDLPSESGFSTALLNAGSVRNRGIELSVNLDVLRGNGSGGGLTWNTGVSYARTKNRVTGLGGAHEIFATTISDDFKLPGSLVRVGEPIGVFYGYQTNGVVRDVADSAAIPHTGLAGRRFQVGDMELVDTNGDGAITTADRTILGSPHPDFNIGWQNSLSFGPLSLTSLVQGAFGQEVLNLNLWRLESATPATNLTQRRFDERWTPDHPDAQFPRFGAGGADATNYTDMIIEDGTYVRLSTVTLGFELPARWLQGRGFSRGRVYVTGSNLLTLTDYTGFNPEVSSFGVGNVNRGIDVGAYPLARSVIFGVNFSY